MHVSPLFQPLLTILQNYVGHICIWLISSQCIMVIDAPYAFVEFAFCLHYLQKYGSVHFIHLRKSRSCILNATIMQGKVTKYSQLSKSLNVQKVYSDVATFPQ